MTNVNAPIHDLLIRVRNGYMARKIHMSGIVFSTYKVEILKLLKQYGFIVDYTVSEEDNKKSIGVVLKEVTNPVDDIPEVKFFSKPSRPRYVGYKDIKHVAGGKGIGIISTSEGVMAAHVAKRKQLGGELIAEIY